MRLLNIPSRRAAAIVLLGAFGGVYAGADDWVTVANDAQRSSWVRTDPKITVDSVRKQEFKLVWKLKPENTAHQLNTLMPGVMLDFYIGYRGFRALGFFAASANKLIAIDTELGRLEWEKDLSKGSAAKGQSLTCPGGITTGATRPTNAAYPSGTGGRRFGRGTPAKSGVGLPDAGAVTLKPVAPPPARPPAGANPFAPRVQWVMALTGDGYLHSMWVSNGNEPEPPVRFLPPGADARGLIVYGNSAYVATTNRCGGVEDGVWTLNLQTKKVSQWKTQTGSVAGAAGIAAGPDGTVYVATTGGELAALEPNTLKQTASAKLPGVQFTSSPVVFEFHGKDLVAVSGNDGRIYLFDTKGLGSGKPLATSAAFSEPGFETGSLTTWVDQKETRWILAAAGGNAATKMGIAGDQGSVEHGAIAAWKVVANSGGATLEPGWVSRDLIAPLPPIVENGVVFALSSGEFRTGNAAVSAAERAKKSTNAVLYALDGDTGKELWNSGGSITSFVHSGGLAGGETRVYLADYEGNEYAFGVPIEH